MCDDAAVPRGDYYRCADEGAVPVSGRIDRCARDKMGGMMYLCGQSPGLLDW